MLQAIPPTIEAKLVEALRARNGRATLGDVIRDTGLGREEAEQHLRALLGLYRSHLAVDEGGELLYLFEPSFVRRVPLPGFEQWLRGALRWSWKAFVVSFKVAVMVILVAYVITFCLLIIAALLALMFAAEDGPDLDIGGGEGCFSGVGDVLWFWDPGVVMYVPSELEWGAGERGAWGHLPTGLREPRALDPMYVTDTYRTRRSRKKRFHDSVFDFVFGPSTPDPPATPDDLEVLEWIVGHRGVITLADLISRTGLSRADAEQEMTRLLTRYEGDVTVSAEGSLLYVFDGLRVTAGEQGRPIRPAPPTWHRFEPNMELTGNTTGRNVLVGGMAGFTLLMAVLSPLLIFPILNIAGTLAVAGLAVIPGLISLLFFAIPTVRTFMVGRENERRRQRNIRRAVLLVLYDHLAQPSGRLYRDDLRKRVGRVLERLQQPIQGGDKVERRVMEGFVSVGQEELSRAIQQVLTEFEAEIDSDAEGRAFLSFPQLERELRDADAARARAGAAAIPIGAIVYSSADEDDAALDAERLEAFDEALGEGGEGGEAAEARQEAEVGEEVRRR